MERDAYPTAGGRPDPRGLVILFIGADLNLARRPDDGTWVPLSMPNALDINVDALPRRLVPVGSDRLVATWQA